MLQGNGATFSGDLDAFAMMAKEKAIAVVRASIQEIASTVVWRTPVGVTGFLRASWQPDINKPPAMQQDQGRSINVSYDDAVPETNINLVLTTVSLRIAQLKPGDTFYLVNGARYAMRVNYGFTGQDAAGRIYNQRGRFWVEDAVKQWKPTVDAQVRAMTGRAAPA